MFRLTGSRAAVCLLTVVMIGSWAFAQTNSCPGAAKIYQDQQYRVNDVRIDTPLSWLLGSVAQRSQNILSALPIKKGEPFDEQKADDSLKQIREDLPVLEVNPYYRVAFRFGRPTLQNCNPHSKTLDLVYRIYTFAPSYYLTRTYESGRKEEVSRSVVKTPATGRMVNYFWQPYLGYNRSRGLFGGTKLTIKQPDGLLDKIVAEASGSSSSSIVKLDAAGAHEFTRGLIRHSEWHLAYARTAVPSSAVKLREGTLSAQFTAATRAFSPQEMVVRFGASIEGGNRQTDLDPRRLPSNALARTGYGAMKAFVGTTLTAGRHSFKSSYGLQVGKSGEGLRVDFVKQIFDTAISLRFVPRRHRPVTVESQMTSGFIHTSGKVPVAERFFGGNVEENFLAGDSWTIRGNPLIRSFPQRRFVPSGKMGATVGGDRFFSINISVAPTIWGYPLVPKQVVNDAGFDRALEIGLSAAEGSLRNRILGNTKEFKEVAALVLELPPVVRQLKDELKKVPSPNPNAEIEAQLKRLFKPAPSPEQKPSGAFDRVEILVGNIADSLDPKNDEEPATRDLVTLAVGDISDPDDPLPSRTEELSEILIHLEELLGASEAGSITLLRQCLEDRCKLIKEKFVALDPPEPMEPSPQAKAANQQAKKEMAYPKRVLDQMIYEANLISVSPVAIFDVAQIGGRGLGRNDTRYAVGGGARVSVMGLDLTAGYAWNLHRRPGEGRGALMFTMTMSNLFR